MTTRRPDTTPWPPAAISTRDELAQHAGQPVIDPNGRNPGDVWTIPTQPFSEAHFAVYLDLSLRTRLAQPTLTAEATA